MKINLLHAKRLSKEYLVGLSTKKKLNTMQELYGGSKKQVREKMFGI